MAKIMYAADGAEPWEITPQAFDRLDLESKLEVLTALQELRERLMGRMLGWF